MSAGAKQRLMSEYKALEREKWLKIELCDGGSLFRWNIGLIVVNSESAFNGGYFKAEMTFTDKYPFLPPTFKFVNPIYHPNIYSDGKLCISILHAPGEDEQSGELASERWSPLQGVESVLRSVLLLLDDPEISSPANVDAGVMYRDSRANYNQKAKEAVESSKKDIPEGFVMPTTLESAPPKEIPDDDTFWNESEAEEDDFGASDSSGDDFDEMDEDEEGEEEEESEEGQEMEE
ncbi:Ubiquitin-conjugating enzyme E2-34 kDa [Lachnellula subtilissima]|uniref:Ubiquitin-conjugating enzyme E2 2 n=1 Tax=Lachnellula subtilissima TaxID=602034 RepID=A0A8H8RXZ9_9HELO|nr:Ubiquitin-conjugating enzyme E2-34 kDa [Lachnellula subtilissima]